MYAASIAVLLLCAGCLLCRSEVIDCKNEAFDTTKKMCCFDKVVDRVPNAVCSPGNLFDGPSSFDSNKKIHCSYRFSRSPALSVKLYDRIENGACCSIDLYDTKNSKCCNMHVGNGAVNFKITKIPTNMMSPQCCGAELYSDVTHICCQVNRMQFSVLRRGAYSKCCGGVDGTQMYDESRSVCCTRGYRSLVSDRPDNSECCGVKPYNHLTHVCRNFLIIARPNNVNSVV